MRKRSRDRKEAIRCLLQEIPGFKAKAADVAGVSPSMVGKVLHGVAVSRKVDIAIEAVLQQESQHAV